MLSAAVLTSFTVIFSPECLSGHFYDFPVTRLHCVLFALLCWTVLLCFLVGHWVSFRRLSWALPGRSPGLVDVNLLCSSAGVTFLDCSCFSYSCAPVCALRRRHQLFPLIAPGERDLPSVLRGVLRPSQILSMDALASHTLLDPTKPGCVLTASRGWAERSSVALAVPQVRLFSACAAGFLPGLSTPPLGVSKGSWLTGEAYTGDACSTAGVSVGSWGDLQVRSPQQLAGIFLIESLWGALCFWCRLRALGAALQGAPCSQPHGTLQYYAGRGSQAGPSGSMLHGWCSWALSRAHCPPGRISGWDAPSWQELCHLGGVVMWVKRTCPLALFSASSLFFPQKHDSCTSKKAPCLWLLSEVGFSDRELYLPSWWHHSRRPCGR